MRLLSCPRRPPPGLLLLSIVLCLSLTQTVSSPLASEYGHGKIVDVASNGDLHLNNGVKLRLQGIDLPSTRKCYGDERLDWMRANLIGKNVSYEVEKRDLMGKSLAYVNASGDVAAQMIGYGYGFALRSFKYRNQQYYLRAEASAKKTQQGVWANCDVDCDDRGCSSGLSIFSCSR